MPDKRQTFSDFKKDWDARHKNRPAKLARPTPVPAAEIETLPVGEAAQEDFDLDAHNFIKLCSLCHRDIITLYDSHGNSTVICPKCRANGAHLTAYTYHDWLVIWPTLPGHLHEKFTVVFRGPLHEEGFEENAQDED